MQDRANLYLVTEYLPGGDLRALVNRNDGALSEELTLFYMAGMGQSVEFTNLQELPDLKK